MPLARNRCYVNFGIVVILPDLLIGLGWTKVKLDSHHHMTAQRSSMYSSHDLSPRHVDVLCMTGS